MQQNTLMELAGSAEADSGVGGLSGPGVDSSQTFVDHRRRTPRRLETDGSDRIRTIRPSTREGRFDRRGAEGRGRTWNDGAIQRVSTRAVGTGVRRIRGGAPATVSVIDISLGGALIAYADPAGLVANDRIVMCLQLQSATAVLLSKVSRMKSGVDFRTYVGLEFCDGQDADLAQLSDELHRKHPGCSPAGRARIDTSREHRQTNSGAAPPQAACMVAGHSSLCDVRKPLHRVVLAVQLTPSTMRHRNCSVVIRSGTRVEESRRPRSPQRWPTGAPSRRRASTRSAAPRRCRAARRSMPNRRPPRSARVTASSSCRPGATAAMARIRSLTPAYMVWMPAARIAAVDINTRGLRASPGSARMPA